MSILGAIKDLFAGNGFDNGGRIRDNSYLRNVCVGSVFGWDEENHRHIYTADRYRLVMTLENWKEYAYKHYSPGEMTYGEVSPSDEINDAVPDCDEFADAAMYFLGVKGLCYERLQAAPAIGIIEYFSKSTNGWHRANIIFCNGYRGLTTAYIFEPQNGKILDFASEVGPVRWIKI